MFPEVNKHRVYTAKQNPTKKEEKEKHRRRDDSSGFDTNNGLKGNRRRNADVSGGNLKCLRNLVKRHKLN